MGIDIAIIAQQLTISRLEVRRLDPVTGYNARERDANACGSVQPGWARSPRQFLAEVAGEVVAVPGEDVVGGAVEFGRGSLYDGVDLGLGREREALQDLESKRATRWFALGLGPVHARHALPVMSPVCIFLAVDYDARMEEGGADGP